MISQNPSKQFRIGKSERSSIFSFINSRIQRDVSTAYYRNVEVFDVNNWSHYKFYHLDKYGTWLEIYGTSIK